MMKAMKKDGADEPVKVNLEINPRSAVMKRLFETHTAAPEKAKLVAEQILDNALIYGCPPGRAAVAVDLAFETGTVVFSVTDTGPGIPVALRERVFDRFFRLQDADDGGCGLGLAIVQDVAEAHGGTARVASHVGGARIEVSLPG